MTQPQPGEIKMAIERKALELGVTITGVHSVLMADNDTVDAIFDTEPDVSGGCGLHFQFPLPQLVSRNDLTLFAWWLAAPDTGMTIH